MSFQILDIVLYGKNRKQRIISLKPGQLNIITGASKTGKTAIMQIIDYCLGSRNCKIPDGAIRKTVEWAGIRLQISEGQFFTARKLPSGKQTSSDVYYDIQNVIELPEYSDLIANTNPEALKGYLSKYTGIGENIHEPPPGQTRPPITANIRHALYFCFQHQSEVSSDKQLFHRQNEAHIHHQTIKDVIPYFLGAVNDDYVAKRKELRDLKHDLGTLDKKLSEYDALKGDGTNGTSRAHTLLVEAQNVGLYPEASIPDSWKTCVEALKSIQENSFVSVYEPQTEGNKLVELSKISKDLENELVRLKEQLESVKEFLFDKDGYSREASAHFVRLKSINLFDSAQEGTRLCPLCKSQATGEVPLLAAIEKSANKLENQIRVVEESSPQMKQLVGELEAQIRKEKQEFRANDKLMKDIINSDKKLQQIGNHKSKCTHTIGRISYYLDNVTPSDDNSDNQNEKKKLDERIKQLKNELSSELIREHLDSILSIINNDINSLAKQLHHEYSNVPLRLDIKSLTVFADKEDGAVLMERMGGGANWVGCHLIAHLALHKWFVRKRRPLPRLLFFDQISQVYFPAEKDVDGSMNEIKDEDREAVARMYKLTLSVVQSLCPDFQIIMTDHADIQEDWFQDCVIERWRKGNKLIPESWLDTE